MFHCGHNKLIYIIYIYIRIQYVYIYVRTYVCIYHGPCHHSMLSASHSYPCPQPFHIFLRLLLCLAPSAFKVIIYLPIDHHAFLNMSMPSYLFLCITFTTFSIPNHCLHHTQVPVTPYFHIIIYISPQCNASSFSLSMTRSYFCVTYNSIHMRYKPFLTATRKHL